MSSFEKDLSKGNVVKQLILFAVPFLVSNIIQSCYNVADMLIVGNFSGTVSMSGVNIGGQVTFILTNIVVGLCTGGTVLIAQYLGAQKREEMRRAVATLMTTLICAAVIITVVSLLLKTQILGWIRTPEESFEEASRYLTVTLTGIIFIFGYNVLSAVMRGMGDSKRPFYFVLIACVTNIVLDLLFVIQFNMGVAGVAWATLIAQGMCAVFSFFVLIARLRKMENEEAAKGKSFTFFDMSSAERIAKVGVPSMLQQSIVSISMMLMQGLVNSYGKVFVAGYTAATKIDTLAMMPNMNFSNAMSSYAAQNIGARKMDRVKQGYKASMFMVVVFSLIITSIIFLFGPQLLGLFLKQGAEGSAMSYGLSYMKTVSVFYILMGALFVSNGLLRGAGDMGAFMLSSVVNLFSRVAIAYLLAHFIGASAIWWSIPTGWAIGALFSFLRVRSGKWMARRLVD